MLSTIFLGFIACFTSQGQSQDKMEQILTSIQGNENTPNFSFSKKFIALGTGYEFGLPVGRMATGMSPVHSLKMSSLLPINFITANLQMGVDVAYGLYGVRTFDINYRQNGNYINTSVMYNSDVAQGGVVANYLFFKKSKIRPYLSARMGYVSLSSSFSIQDPTDIDACRVLESKTIQSDGTLYWGYGFGLSWNIGKISSTSRHFIDFSVTKMGGNALDYVNVNYLHNHNSVQPLSSGAKPLNVTFVNANTQNTHDHRIAELYNNPLNILQLKIGYVVHLRLKSR